MQFYFKQIDTIVDILRV